MHMETAEIKSHTIVIIIIKTYFEKINFAGKQNQFYNAGLAVGAYSQCY